MGRQWRTELNCPGVVVEQNPDPSSTRRIGKHISFLGALLWRMVLCGTSAETLDPLETTFVSSARSTVRVLLLICPRATRGT